MRRFSILSCLFVVLCSLFGACSSENIAQQNYANLQLRISPSTAFTTSQSRAADLTQYENTSNYDLVIKDQAGSVVFSGLVGQFSADANKLSAGSYEIIASFGEDKVATRNNFYVEGSANFEVTESDVNEGKTVPVTVVCQPKCSRVSVAFGNVMDNYFSDYYVTFQSATLTSSQATVVFGKDEDSPYYLKMNGDEEVKAIIHVVRKSDSRWTEFERTQTLANGKSWTLKINAKEPDTQSPGIQQPEDVDATIGLLITIDDSTVDKSEVIVVPNDWWM